MKLIIIFLAFFAIPTFASEYEIAYTTTSNANDGSTIGITGTLTLPELQCTKNLISAFNHLGMEINSKQGYSGIDIGFNKTRNKNYWEIMLQYSTNNKESLEKTVKLLRKQKIYVGRIPSEPPYILFVQTGILASDYETISMQLAVCEQDYIKFKMNDRTIKIYLHGANKKGKGMLFRRTTSLFGFGDHNYLNTGMTVVWNNMYVLGKDGVYYPLKKTGAFLRTSSQFDLAANRWVENKTDSQMIVMGSGN